MDVKVLRPPPPPFLSVYSIFSLQMIEYAMYSYISLPGSEFLSPKPRNKDCKHSVHLSGIAIRLYSHSIKVCCIYKVVVFINACRGYD